MKTRLLSRLLAGLWPAGAGLRPGLAWAQTVFIRWASHLVAGAVALEFFDGRAWQTLAASTADDGIEPWTLPSGAFAGCKIRVSDQSAPEVLDESPEAFRIGPEPPRLVTAAMEAGRFVLTFALHPGAPNLLQRTLRLGPADWQTLTIVTHQGATGSWFDPEGPFPAALYRIVAE